MPTNDMFTIPSGSLHFANLKWGIVNEADEATQFYNIALGYQEVCLFSLHSLLKNHDRKNCDVWIFPILFNAVHAIELYLKVYNFYIKNLNGNSSVKIVNGKHQLKQLYDTAYAETIKNTTLNSDKSLISSLKDASKFIDMIHKKFGTGTDFARYSVKSNGTNHVYADTQNEIRIDLINFKSQLETCFKALHDSCFYLNVIFDEQP